MSNETLATTRRAMVTAFGAVAMNALLPFTALAGRRRQRSCQSDGASYCSPCYVSSGIVINDPPFGLVIENPSGSTHDVSGNVPPFPNFNNWPTRVIATIQLACFTVNNAPTAETVSAPWFKGDLGPTGGNFTVEDVVAAAGLPSGYIYGASMGPFFVSAIAQIKSPTTGWGNVTNGANALYGHTPRP